MTTATPPDADSLRERKRRATKAAIEDAATALVLEHGYDAVTVEEICARADVSKRTFFNYVPSKEAAVTGTAPSEVPEAAIARFREEASGEDGVLRAVLRLLLGTFAADRLGDGSHTATIVTRRRAIFREAPELGAARMTSSSRFHLLLTGIVSEHLAAHPEQRSLPDLPAEDESRACVALVATAANLGFSTWVEASDSGEEGLLAACRAALDHLSLLLTPPSAHPAAGATPTIQGAHA